MILLEWMIHLDMSQIQFDPIDLILACPHKWYLLELVDSGIVAKSSLYNDPHMRRISVNRHTQEMISEGLIKSSSDDHLSITKKGKGIVKDLKQMKKAFKNSKII